MKLTRIATLGLFISTFLLFSGCTAKGPQFEKFETPKQDEANIYIYRKAIIFGDGLQPDIHQTNLSTNEDKVLPKVLPDGYIMQALKPGEYQFWAKTEAKNEVNVHAEANNIYCIQHYVTPGAFVGHPQFELQDLKTCEVEIKKTKLSLP